jgi:hypothetical protein
LAQTEYQLLPFVARPQVADGGDALQFKRVDANILKRSRGQEARGGPPAWGLGLGLTTPHCKIKLVTKILKRHRIWNNFFDKRPKRKKIAMRFDTWIVRSMYRAGWLRAAAEEISKYKLDFVGVQEVRWN